MGCRLSQIILHESGIAEAFVKPDYRSPITNHQLLVTGYRLLITDYWLPITDYLPPCDAIGRSSSYASQF
jgi:hypothetical protein